MGGIGQTGVVYVDVLTYIHQKKKVLHIPTYPHMLDHEWYGFIPIIYFLLIGLGTFK